MIQFSYLNGSFKDKCHLAISNDEKVSMKIDNIEIQST